MSDSDSSVDSDSGIRFKTQSVRNLSKDNTIIVDRPKKHNDYEYKYDKRYIRDDDYRYRKRHKHSDGIRSSSRREDYFQDERSTSSKRETISKSYNLDSASHKSRDSYESNRRKKEIITVEDGDIIDTYGPPVPTADTSIRKRKESHETKKEIVKLNKNVTINTYRLSSPSISVIHKSKNSNETKKEIVKLENNKTSDTINELNSMHNAEPINKSLNTYGPTLTSKPEPIVDDVKKAYGPTLPSSSVKKLQETAEDENTYGPCVPLNVVKPKPEKTFGPSLPSTLVKSVPSSNGNAEDTEKSTKIVKIYGPTLPSTSTNIKMSPESNEDITEESISTAPENADQSDDDDDDEEEDMIGPLLPGMAAKSRVQSELECRALELKMKLEFPSEDKKTREDWMVELPGIQKVSGLGPRKFRANAGPDLSDRSSWTDTPQEKAKKHGTKSMKTDLKIEAENLEIQRRDKEQEKISKSHKKHSKRDKSLMDIHQQKLAKEKKEAGKTERRPFNRDIDLKLNMFDPDKKSRMLKNACLLDDKFSTGKSKYL